MLASISLDPCAPNPCGPGECEITANILNGYICRCVDGSIQMTNCSTPKSNEPRHVMPKLSETKSTMLILDPCAGLPCGPSGRCLALNAAPKGYMCMCQNEGITFTTIDTCPSKERRLVFLAHRSAFVSRCAFSVHAEDVQERRHLRPLLAQRTVVQHRPSRCYLLSM